MRRILVPALALGAVSTAAFAEPVTLTNGEMDAITAGQRPAQAAEVRNFALAIVDDIRRRAFLAAGRDPEEVPTGRSIVRSERSGRTGNSLLGARTPPFSIDLTIGPRARRAASSVPE